MDVLFNKVKLYNWLNLCTTEKVASFKKGMDPFSESKLINKAQKQEINS